MKRQLFDLITCSHIYLSVLVAGEHSDPAGLYILAAAGEAIRIYTALWTLILEINTKKLKGK